MLCEALRALPHICQPKGQLTRGASGSCSGAWKNAAGTPPNCAAPDAPSTRPGRTSISSGSPTNAGPAPTPATMGANAMFPFRGASDDPTGVPGAAVTNAGATADEGLAAARALGRMAQQTQEGLCVTHGAPPRLQRWRAGTVTGGGGTAAGASGTTTARRTVCETVSAKGSETASCSTSTHQ